VGGKEYRGVSAHACIQLKAACGACDLCNLLWGAPHPRHPHQRVPQHCCASQACCAALRAHNWPRVQESFDFQAFRAPAVACLQEVSVGDRRVQLPPLNWSWKGSHLLLLWGTLSIGWAKFCATRATRSCTTWAALSARVTPKCQVCGLHKCETTTAVCVCVCVLSPLVASHAGPG
jgi:hypothetical protein